MAYALHRRQAFRSAGGVTGWGFDLTKSTFVASASLLSSAAGASAAGTAMAIRNLAISSDGSKLVVRPRGVGGSVYLREYDFPSGHYGEISAMDEAPYSASSRSTLLYSSLKPFAFSNDGLHYIQQGTSSQNAYQNVGVNDLISCPVDSELDITSIPNNSFSSFSVLSELSENIRGLAFSEDGLQLIVLFGGAIRSYYLQTAFDVSSASLSYTQISLSRFGLSSNAYDMKFSPDGYTLVLLRRTSDSDNASFHVFKLSVPFNITTLSLDTTWQIPDANRANYIYGFTIDRDGNNLYIARDVSVLQYSLSA
jgi:hypothetical protein